MSLNWNATNVAGLDWETMDDEVKNDIAQFAFVLMAVGMPVVSEKNYKEVSARIAFFENLNGLIAYSQETPDSPRIPTYTKEFVKSMIGYTTNVSALPIGKWSKNLLERS